MLIYMRKIGCNEMRVLRDLKLMRAPTPGHADSIEIFLASFRHKMLAWGLEYETYGEGAAIVLKQQGNSKNSVEQGVHANYLPLARKPQKKAKKRARTQDLVGAYLDEPSETDDDDAI